jgi:hypothetical protein
VTLFAAGFLAAAALIFAAHLAIELWLANTICNHIERGRE